MPFIGDLQERVTGEEVPVSSPTAALKKTVMHAFESTSYLQ
jgi:hypothetical protein